MGESAESSREESSLRLTREEGVVGPELISSSAEVSSTSTVGINQCQAAKFRTNTSSRSPAPTRLDRQKIGSLNHSNLLFNNNNSISTNSLQFSAEGNSSGEKRRVLTQSEGI